MTGNDANLDRRTITQLMLDQIEFANVIVVSKAGLFLRAESEGAEQKLEKVTRLLGKLNPQARVVVPRVDMYGDLDVAKELLCTGSFDMDEAQTSASWWMELEKVKCVRCD